ncbi:glycosyltransferase family 17 [Phlyctema vagabunda]|uniref:Glycosyltransferase family 17 n=1 Tax=Phlyctema vagabunda TaxID=108571 RepID=A0ABR4P5S7_9HELO
MRHPPQILSIRKFVSAEDIAYVESQLEGNVTAIGRYGHLPEANVQIQCSAQGWRPFAKQRSLRKVYDLFIINDQLDWLEIRLNELDNSVDYFVILESATTLTGLPKTTFLKDNWARFEKFHDKIIYHELVTPTKNEHTVGVDEDFQRNALFTQVIPGLTNGQAPRLGDVILVSDIDEIPRPTTLSILRNCDFPRRVTLRSRFYHYGFQWLHKGPEWEHPQATTYQGPRGTILPADLRKGPSANGILGWFGNTDLYNAAWHCSLCLPTIDGVSTKMTSFSYVHSEQQVFLDRTRIVDRVRKGLDLWDREGELYDRIENNDDLPRYLKDNKEKFTYMISRDNPSAGFSDFGLDENWVD